MRLYHRSQVGTLCERLAEVPERLIVLSGPRQTGKTTIARQALRLISLGGRYLAADEPDPPGLRVPSAVAEPAVPVFPLVQVRDAAWLVRSWQEARIEAEQSGGFVLVLDEIQKIGGWSETVKGLWDADRARGCPLRVVILGSAPLLMQSGLSESLAGRFELIRVSHWSFREMVEAFDFDLDRYLYFGGYPGAARFVQDEGRWRSYVLDSLVEPNIERDILAMTRVDKPALLKQLFELGAAYSGQILSYNNMLGQLQDAGNTITLARYLDLLCHAGLLAGLQKYSSRPLRRRASSPKLNVINTALMTACSGYSFGQAMADRTFWGRLVESAAGAHLLNTKTPDIGLHYWRGEPARGRLRPATRSPDRRRRGQERAKTRFPTWHGRIYAAFPAPAFAAHRRRRHTTQRVSDGARPPLVRGNMNTVVSRTCTEIPDEDTERGPKSDPRPLEEFRSRSAYVLLGDPGAGKTTSFKAECEALGESAHYLTARDFRVLDVGSHPEWRGRTLFIDGLDEVRAGQSDARTPFDEIRGRLDALGRPRFRLSCREADWLGPNDRKNLERVSHGAGVAVLRLDPLDDDDIAEILAADSRVDDAELFIATARQRGVDGLLANPQTLGMLADAVAGGGEWPEDRRATFEMACRQMASERNEEHVLASQQATPEQLLDAAGCLCAVQLISGAAGYTLEPGQPDRDYPDLDACGYESHGLLRSAVSTRLFRAESEGRFVPVHRHVAEFLGARYLASAVDGELPVRRVLALITGEDGGVVTELRGLSAWLAAHSEQARAFLIERDPVGVGLYGDISGFTSDEKHALLESLHSETYRLGPLWMEAEAFAGLATPDMEPEIREVLTDPDRSDEHEGLTMFLLRVLTEAAPLPWLSDDLPGVLLGIVRDSTRGEGPRWFALTSYIRVRHDEQEAVGELKRLLADIQEERVPDPDRELRGKLLSWLYPEWLAPSEVWDYLQEIPDTRVIHVGAYEQFWGRGLLDKSSDEQVAELLDSLVERLPDLRSALDRPLEDLPTKLLARGLKAHGEELDRDAGRLYDWLSVTFTGDEYSLYGHRVSGEEAAREVRVWLEQHPEALKAVLMEGLERGPDSDEFAMHAFQVDRRLYHADLPPGFGLWCLEQAVALADTKPRVAEHLFKLAVRRRGAEGLSLKALKHQAQANEAFKATLGRLLAPDPAEPPEYRDQVRRFTEEREQQEQQWLDYVRSTEETLRENRAPPALLHQLAQTYFEGFQGDFERFGEGDGAKAIRKQLRGDPRLTKAALQGLRGTIDREDLPDTKETLKLRRKDRMHYLELPFLAGLAELERTTPEEDAAEWSEARARKALTFSYCAPHANYEPGWYRRLLETRPEAVAEAQVQVAVSELRSGRAPYDARLWEFVHNPAYAQVAERASLPLLEAFPSRCSLNQLQSLDYLLWAAMQHADRTQLQNLVEKKLSQPDTDMNVAQRAHWLAAGVIVSPEVHTELLEAFARTGRKQQRSLWLAEFFHLANRTMGPSEKLVEQLKTPVTELLIRLIGANVRPDEWPNESPMHASSLVRALIQQLSSFPARDVSDALDRLHANPALLGWRDALSQARDSQQVTRRDANYHHPSVEHVRQTLEGGTPANSADLAALVTDLLEEMAARIRTGNTDDWRQYWNVNHHGQPASPRHEDPCRDALLSDLKMQLPQGVDAQPEGQYANDARADIRIAHQDFEVPVEVKRNAHRGLWSAPRNQLIAQYTIDPATGGHGIYLVLWFGEEHTQPPPSGTRPANPQELKNRLQATLTDQQRRKITVCVTDVSPHSPASS